MKTKASFPVFCMPRWLLAVRIVLLSLLALPTPAGAHAALERSEPAAGTSLATPPAEIRIWFAEPLEQTYTGAELLDASGTPVQGATAAVAPENARQMVISVPPGLPDGTYTVAWRTLSSADGHTLDGFFGFSVGTASGSPTAGVNTAGSDVSRPLSRGLALLGLAALMALAPLTLWLFDSLARAIPSLNGRLSHGLRRYALFAALAALSGSAVALAAQSLAIAPEASLPEAIARTIGETRYGQLWLMRLALLGATIVLSIAALWGRERWRRPMLLMATATTLLCPIPFSLLSHAAAQTDGRAAAMAVDVLHLMTAALWAGGLFMLALVLLPLLRTMSPEERVTALRVAIPRFSVLGVSAWAILLLSGLYASWLQVGTIAALRETDYGQTLLLKGLLLLPVLALAAFHFVLGWRGVAPIEARRLIRTLVIEGLIVAVVLLVVGRLIGLEPAREVFRSRHPVGLEVALTFDEAGDARRGTLSISPGVPGNNTFTLTLDGEALPSGSEGVLRFSLPSQSIGEQELRLPEVGSSQFRVEGPELTLAGDWQLSAIVRKIGDYSLQSAATIPIGSEPPAAPEPNPAPLFGTGGVVGLIALAIGIVAAVTAALAQGTAAGRRGMVAAAGGVAVLVGALLLSTARLPGTAALPAPPSATVAPRIRASPPATALSSPESAAMTLDHHMGSATPEPAAATMGTPVKSEGFSVVLSTDLLEAGPADVTVHLVANSGEPLADARVVILSDMPAMDSDPIENVASEVDPGRYLAEGVPLGMAGEWRLAVRISPRGASTRVIPFVIEVP